MNDKEMNDEKITDEIEVADKKTPDKDIVLNLITNLRVVYIETSKRINRTLIYSHQGDIKGGVGVRFQYGGGDASIKGGVGVGSLALP